MPLDLVFLVIRMIVFILPPFITSCSVSANITMKHKNNAGSESLKKLEKDVFSIC